MHGLDAPVVADVEALTERAHVLMRGRDASDRNLIDAAMALSAAIAQCRQRAQVDEARLSDLQADLFWCKKQMTVDQITAYRAASASAERPHAAAPVDRDAATITAAALFAEAEDFAQRTPDAFLQCVRYFEVAQRFPETDVGRLAQQKSLAAQIRAMRSQMQDLRQRVAP
ncbi:MAG: hypothetical protein J0M02_00510 [Planctomycetes bacterium]|nr:hypothetical protein [Planctomycetota bacterium]